MPRSQPSFVTENRPFASNLSYIMKERHITQKQLGDVIGKRPQTISLYQLGQSEPDASTILEIANYLNVTVDWLIGRENAPFIYGMEESAAAAALGLTDEAGKVAHNNSKYTNLLLTSPDYQSLMDAIARFVSLTEPDSLLDDVCPPERDDPNDHTLEYANGGIRVSRADAIAGQRHLASVAIDRILEGIERDAAEKRARQNEQIERERESEKHRLGRDEC